jgi:predicted AAA+ superfamily ATPase
MEKASESLAGRVGIIELAPLSQREIDRDSFTLPFVPTMDYIKERSHSVIMSTNIWERIHRGGYPELQDPEVEWSMFFSSYVKTYLEIKTIS